MSFDRTLFVSSPSNWFSIDIQYQGQGRAKFLNPQGIIQGRTTIQFNELGESIIEMNVEDIQTEQPLDFGLWELLSGNKPTQVGNTKQLGFGGTRNTCIELEVITPDGIFSANEHIHHGFSTTASGTKMEFSVLSPQFDISDARKVKYWVIPLSNFISNFVANHPVLDNHPLRIFPTPIVPEDFPEEDKMNATLIANQKNRLITFRFDGSPGFIEPLSDFDERKDSLLNGQSLNRITSVMVGEVSSNSVESGDLNQWFPFDFLLLLGLASGTEVGAPWIEFRDAESRLVKGVIPNLRFWSIQAKMRSATDHKRLLGVQNGRNKSRNGRILRQMVANSCRPYFWECARWSNAFIVALDALYFLKGVLLSKKEYIAVQVIYSQRLNPHPNTINLLCMLR